MKTISKPEQFDNKDHLGVILFPAKEDGKVEYVAFKDQGELEAWASKELAKKTGQRNFRVISALPRTLQVQVDGGVTAKLVA